MTESKKLERDSSNSKRKRLQKVHFRLPKSRNKWWIVKPFDARNRFVARWKIFMLLPLSVEVWIFPYRLAIGVPSISSEMQLIFAEFAVDVLSLIDMVITLCTAIPANNPNEEPVTTFRGIARRYFKYEFLFGVLPSYPYWVGLFLATDQVQQTCQSLGEPGKISWACVMFDQSLPVTLWWALSGVRVVPRFFRLVRDVKAGWDGIVTDAR